MLPLLIIPLIVLNVVVLTSLNDKSVRVKQQQVQTVKTTEKIKKIESLKELTEKSLKQEQTKSNSLKTENESLKVSLQAKQEAERVATEEAQVAKAVQTVRTTGSHTDWLAAAGIPESDWQYADYIVSNESSWNPNAVNADSGACGLAQQLPCGKWAGAWNDPVASLVAQYGYVKARYGGYAGAYSFWVANSWY